MGFIIRAPAPIRLCCQDSSCIDPSRDSGIFHFYYCFLLRELDAPDPSRALHCLNSGEQLEKSWLYQIIINEETHRRTPPLMRYASVENVAYFYFEACFMVNLILWNTPVNPMTSLEVYEVAAYPDGFIIDTGVGCPQSNVPAFVDKLWGQKLVGSHQLSVSFSMKLKKKKQIETVRQGVCRHVGLSHYIEAWGESRENAVVGSPVLIILTTLLLSRPCGSGLPRAPNIRAHAVSPPPSSCLFP